jgi:hypothetical protein
VPRPSGGATGLKSLIRVLKGNIPLILSAVPDAKLRHELGSAS